MIVSEILNDKLIRHHSDSNKRIRQIETNIVYDEAVDLLPCRYTYVETDEDIYGGEDNADES